MPTSRPFPAAAPPSTTARRPRSWPTWLREPLLHFTVIGAALFGIDHVLFARADDPHRIVLDAQVDDEARQVFKSSRGRDPNAEESKALRKVWLDNEVLYREGLAMRVDRGDTAIRERVIFKSLSVIDAGVKLPPIDDAGLRRWFEQHHAKYDEPARYDFQEAVLTGDNAEPAVRAFVDALNAGAPGDTQAGLRVFKGRPRSNVEQSYGAVFVRALDTATVGEWRAQPSDGGVRVIRLDAISPPKPPVFDALRNVVRQDWADATLAEQRSAAVAALTRKYKVVVEAAQP